MHSEQSDGTFIWEMHICTAFRVFVEHFGAYYDRSKQCNPSEQQCAMSTLHPYHVRHLSVPIQLYSSMSTNYLKVLKILFSLELSLNPIYMH